MPGYAVLGDVDAVGEGVTDVRPGDRVAALTQFGGHAQMIEWAATDLVHVPPELDPARAVVLILNYLVAYQILHRVVQVQPGEKALIIGASGGVGTAFLDLGRLAGLTMYGLASAPKHPILEEHGATPIDYRTQDMVQVLQQAEPAGIDYVFNGMGEEYFGRALAVLRRGGMLIHYGGPQSFGRFLLLVGKLLLSNLLPNGKKIVGYGTHRLGTDLFKKDWATLFGLLATGKIKPVIAKTLPFAELIEANRLLENGRIIGNLVLTFSENHE